MTRRLEQARRLLALAQTGLHYSTGPFDTERYREIANIAHAQLAEIADMSTQEVAVLFSKEEGYANPKVDVRCAVFDETGRILLVREAAEGLWSLPGGWADVGATPAENAAREVREESGYIVHITRLLAVWDMQRHSHPPSLFHIWKLVFLGEIVASGELVGGETDGADFFGLDALPTLSLGRVLPEQLRRLDELRRCGDVEFD
ncbi:MULTISPECIES: NUDIX hydrolase [Paraburkholderia]|uniref:NUDIX hydrolase n=1 Tax=Paraburkholderia podalyriae TaxID=1938811 RepID=A0ABR7PQR4_9BURK|nr:NUDIX hydrolase [Paraburkholderia podalyriae]MBC8748594.1 NUDIX hydrolase [Paraburkholderia podalyriae]